MKRALLTFATLALAATSFADDDAESATFSKDVAPIFFKGCVTCHRPGDIGPMSLMDYKSVRPWVKSIKKSIADGTMPPWHADSSAVKYRNDLSLSPQEKETVLRWIDQGAPEGNAKDLPAAPVFDDTWAMGKPDIIFHATKDFTIPPNDSAIEYQAITFDMSAVTEDLYIQAWEIRPTILGVVHHANMAIGPKSFEGVASGNIIPHGVLNGGDYIGSYLPGCRPMVYPEGTAYRIPKGSFAAIQVHYVGKEKELTDHLMFGVKLAQGRIDKQVRVVGLFGVDGNIKIPPGEPNYELVGSAKLLFDTLVYSSGVHMHLRGKDFILENILADGSSKLVTRIPHYDFNWQTTYWLADPIRAPKGSQLRTIVHYDNSPQNPNNPDPNAWVKNGPWTTDEMLNSWSHCVIADEKLGFKVENGKVVGKFEDAQLKPHPRLIQSLDVGANLNKDADFFHQKGVAPDMKDLKKLQDEKAPGSGAQ